MEDYENIDMDEVKALSKSKKRLRELSSDKYWNEYNGDWKGYMSEVFKYELNGETLKETVDTKLKLPTESSLEVDSPHLDSTETEFTNPFW